MQRLKITKIEKLEMVADRYDIQVADNENFFANGVLVHNCRTIAFVTSTNVTYYSRSGKEAAHLNGLFDFDLHKLRDLLGHDYVLDAEAFASDFTETINAKKEGNDAAKDALRLRAFFLMPMVDWVSQKTKITMRHNRFFLEECLKRIESSKVIISEGREVKDYSDMVAYCNEVIDVHKREGLILKNWESTYQWDRTIDWCKVKRMWDVDGKIVGFYPGRKKSRLENTLGGITVRGVDEHGTPFEVNVGSGFTDDMRTEIWNNRDKYLDATVTVQYQEMCKAKGADVMSLRFPVFMRFRDDKIVEV
jgi:ATP-dependent DNA ligase